MKFAELKKRVMGGEVLPVYYLTGTDEYLKSSAVRILKSKVEMPELDFVSLESPTSAALLDALTTLPMMSGYRLVKTDCPTEVDALEGYTERRNATGVLIITDPPAPSAKKSKAAEGIKRFLSKAEEIDCSPLDERFIFGWIASEAKKYDVQVERSAAALLTEYCRSDMSRISSEFDKLASYRAGDTVREEDVRTLVEPELEFAVWQLSGAVAAGNAKEAMRIYNSFDVSAKTPEMMFGALYSHFRKLYYSLVTDDDALLAKELGMRGGAVYANRREAAKFGKERLEKILLALAETDEDIKNGVLPRELASEVLIFKTLTDI